LCALRPLHRGGQARTSAAVATPLGGPDRPLRRLDRGLTPIWRDIGHASIAKHQSLTGNICGPFLLGERPRGAHEALWARVHMLRRRAAPYVGSRPTTLGRRRDVVASLVRQGVCGACPGWTSSGPAAGARTAAEGWKNRAPPHGRYIVVHHPMGSDCVRCGRSAGAARQRHLNQWRRPWRPRSSPATSG